MERLEFQKGATRFVLGEGPGLGLWLYMSGSTGHAKIRLEDSEVIKLESYLIGRKAEPKDAAKLANDLIQAGRATPTAVEELLDQIEEGGVSPHADLMTAIDALPLDQQREVLNHVAAGIINLGPE